MKKIVSAKAVGHNVLVEMLSEQEASGTSLVLSNKSNQPSKQAYIVDLGPCIANSDQMYGLKVGSRVLLQGIHVPIPVKSADGRDLSIVTLHDIKAVLAEEE